MCRLQRLPTIERRQIWLLKVSQKLKEPALLIKCHLRNTMKFLRFHKRSRLCLQSSCIGARMYLCQMGLLIELQPIKNSPIIKIRGQVQVQSSNSKGSHPQTCLLKMLMEAKQARFRSIIRSRHLVLEPIQVVVDSNRP